MLKMIERKGGHAIWKSSDNQTGVTNFYGVRPVVDKDKPFTSRYNTLYDARAALDIEGYNAEMARKYRRPTG